MPMLSTCEKHTPSSWWVNWVSLASCGQKQEPEHNKHYSWDVDGDKVAQHIMTLVCLLG